MIYISFNNDTVRSDKVLAIQLRREGNSYTVICRRLGIPKSTLSGWFTSLRYSEEIRNKLQKAANRKFSKVLNQCNEQRAAQYEIDREHRITQASKQVVPMSMDRLFWFGLALFWAEGSKKNRFSVRFANSDPVLAQAWCRFLEEICEVSRDRIRVNLHLHPNVTERKAKEYWAQMLGLLPSQFRKSQVQLPASSRRKRPPHSLPYGTCHLSVNNSLLKQRIEGWMRGVAGQITDS